MTVPHFPIEIFLCAFTYTPLTAVVAVEVLWAYLSCLGQQGGALSVGSRRLCVPAQWVPLQLRNPPAVEGREEMQKKGEILTGCFNLG